MSAKEPKPNGKWFIFPTTNPQDEDIEVSLEDARTRVRFIMSIYEWLCVDTIGTAEFERRISQYYETFVDFESKEWRLRDLGSFWGSLFACAFDQDLMNRWLYAEKRLFEFRMKTYFATRESMLTLLKNNADRMVNVEFVPSVEERFKPKGHKEGREVYFRVPWETIYGIVGKGEVSIHDGYAYIDWRHIGDWLWCQIENNFSIALRDICPKSGDIERDGEAAGVEEDEHKEFLFIKGCTEEAQEALELEENLKKLKRKRERAYGGGPPGCITDIEDLVAASQILMPPCQALHVYNAKEHGKHPKYEARKAFSMFALESGHEVDEVEKALFLLWELDTSVTQDTNRFPRGFTMEEFLKECKDVSGLHKAMHRSFEPIKAYGCGGLVKRSMCPLSGKNLNKKFLKWLGLDSDTIRKIEATKAQEWECSARCTVAFKAKYPHARELVIKHPNMYYREAGRAGNPWIKKQKEKE